MIVMTINVTGMKTRTVTTTVILTRLDVIMPGLHMRVMKIMAMDTMPGSMMTRDIIIIAVKDPGTMTGIMMKGNQTVITVRVRPAIMNAKGNMACTIPKDTGPCLKAGDAGATMMSHIATTGPMLLRQYPPGDGIYS